MPGIVQSTPYRQGLPGIYAASVHPEARHWRIDGRVATPHTLPGGTPGTRQPW